MPKGGARTRSGPAPDPNALARERDEGEWVELPAEGRQGEAPPFPLPGLLEREVDLWGQLWSMPQALMWERFRQHYEVALYVRRFAEAEQPETATTLNTLVRQMADSLGLTIPGMRAARWKIARGDQPEPRRSTPSSRARLSVVPGDGA